MYSTFMEPGDFRRGWLCFGVAGSAKADQIPQVVTAGDCVGNDVMNVKFTPLSRNLRLMLPACLASIPIPLADILSDRLPAETAPVVLRSSTLPAESVGAGRRANAGFDVTLMRTELAVLTLGRFKSLFAMAAFSFNRANPTPTAFMVALHCAVKRGIGPTSVNRKFSAASNALLQDLCKWLSLAPLGSLPGRWRRISVSAGTGAILSRCSSSERFFAFFAGVVYCSHSGTISGTPFKIKYFDIAVKRITDAHRQTDLFVAKPPPVAPVQEGFDI
jgi:hypothetical protein